MSECLTPSLLVGWRCDKAGCAAHLKIAARSPFDKSADKVLADNRWSRWVGRSVKHYCSLHGPTPGHKMWRSV